MILYVLLRPVNKNLALLAAVFELVGDAIGGVISLGHFSAVLILGGAQYLTVVPTDQLHALALLSLKLHGYGYDLELVPISFRDMLLGHLIFKSGYLSRVIGILLPIAGLNFLANSVTDFLGIEYAVPGSFSWTSRGRVTLPVAYRDGCEPPEVGKTCNRVPRDSDSVAGAVWGEGYAREAGDATIALAFTTLGLSDLYAGQHPDNHRSRRILKGVGFRYTHDEIYPPTGAARTVLPLALERAL